VTRYLDSVEHRAVTVFDLAIQKIKQNAKRREIISFLSRNMYVSQGECIEVTHIQAHTSYAHKSSVSDDYPTLSSLVRLLCNNVLRLVRDKTAMSKP
jgi:hypothetical protein